MYDEIRSLPSCAEKLCSLMSLSDASSEVLRFVSDDVWGSSERILVSRCIAGFLEKAWDHPRQCPESWQT
jgi:hypothetical protein